jgi:hypothetical protein
MEILFPAICPKCGLKISDCVSGCSGDVILATPVYILCNECYSKGQDRRVGECNGMDRNGKKHKKEEL